MLIIIEWFLKCRLFCHIKGCNLKYKYEQEFLVEVWCNRCGNYHNYSSMNKPSKNLFIRQEVKNG